ncbi:MAG: low specificity L-threonine aldolase [Halanaeroarchaeum sp.]
MIDLRSDTVTRPSDEMRRAAAAAEVGDDVYEMDPTVNELEARAAEIVGTEDALFVPSGTMGNQIAARVHTDRGQEALVEEESHVVRWELGGFAEHSDLQVRMLDGGPRGIPTPEQIRDGYVEEDLHRPGTGLLSLENTHNYRGGIAIAPEKIAAAAEAAHDLDVPVHLDGARVFNAALARDVDVTAFTDPVDTVMFCLSKGLGAPIGSLLAGDEAFVEAARRVRKLMGGGWRQAGIVAAPGLVALENREHLADDHANAKRLADGLAGVDGLDVLEPETNIVMVDAAGLDMTAREFLDRLETADVYGVPRDGTIARFTTSWEVDAADVDRAVERIADVVESL